MGIDTGLCSFTVPSVSVAVCTWLSACLQLDRPPTCPNMPAPRRLHGRPAVADNALLRRPARGAPGPHGSAPAAVLPAKAKPGAHAARAAARSRQRALPPHRGLLADGPTCPAHRGEAAAVPVLPRRRQAHGGWVTGFQLRKKSWCCTGFGLPSAHGSVCWGQPLVARCKAHANSQRSRQLHPTH